MGLFCLPLSSCYTMVDFYLKSRQPQTTAPNLDIDPFHIHGNFTTNAGKSFGMGDNSSLLCDYVTTDDEHNSTDGGSASLCNASHGLFPFLDNGAFLNVTTSTASPQSVYLFDDDTAYWLQVIWICVVHNALILVGLVGNILNLIILSRYGIGTHSTNILLLSMAAIDCVLLLSNGIQNMTCFTCYLDPATATYVDTATNIYLTSPSRWISFVNLDITALIAIERAVAVFFPFSVAKRCNRKVILVVYAFISGLIVVVLLPHMIGVRPYWQFDPELNQTVANTFYFIGNFDGFLIFWSFVENMNAVFCVTVIFACGTATAIRLVQQAKFRGSNSTSNASNAMSQQKRKAVSMLLVVCFISFLVHLPNSLNQLYSSIFLEQLAADGMYCALRSLGSFLGTLNAAANFFIYFFMSSKFKESYKSLMCLSGE